LALDRHLWRRWREAWLFFSLEEGTSLLQKPGLLVLNAGSTNFFSLAILKRNLDYATDYDIPTVSTLLTCALEMTHGTLASYAYWKVPKEKTVEF